MRGEGFCCTAPVCVRDKGVQKGLPNRVCKMYLGVHVSIFTNCDYGLIVPAGVMDGEVIPYGKRFSEWHVWATKKMREPKFSVPFYLFPSRLHQASSKDRNAALKLCGARRQSWIPSIISSVSDLNIGCNAFLSSATCIVSWLVF